MHKMRITFDKEEMEREGVNADGVASEVEDLGFGAELINTFELQEGPDDGEDQNKKKGMAKRRSTLVIEGMTCSSCSNAIEKHLRGIEGITSVSVSLLTNKALIEHD
jgi:Cu+-exporting ATPase